MKVPVYTFDDVRDFDVALERINLMKEMLNNRLLDAIRYGIKNHFIMVRLFEIKLKDNRKFSIRCPRDEWKESLTNMLRYFEEVEEYEKCAEIKKMTAELNSSKL